MQRSNLAATYPIRIDCPCHFGYCNVLFSTGIVNWVTSSDSVYLFVPLDMKAVNIRRSIFRSHTF